MSSSCVAAVDTFVDPETIERISQHPIYGIVEDYGQICIRDVWYRHDVDTDRLLRFTKSSLEDLFPCPAINETLLT